MTDLRRAGRFVVLALSMVPLLLSSALPSAAQEAGVIRWKQVIGLAFPGSAVGGAQPIAFPWTALDGKAWVHLESGHIKFNVSGLVLANSTPLAVVGTIGLVTQVKGTLVCNGLSNVASALVDTPPVPLDPQGNASFVGDVAIPTDCLLPTSSQAFLIRVAAAGNTAIVDRWIAVGVVRTP